MAPAQSRAWYVAKVKPQSEHQVQRSFAMRQISAYVPEITVAKRGKQRMEPLFPTYLFVHTDPVGQDWPLIRWTHGLRYFLPNQRQPIHVPDSLIGEIERRVAAWNGGGWVTAFQPSDRVTIEAGPLRTLDAIFQRYLPGNQRCEILISLLGRPQYVQVDVTHLRGTAMGRRFASLELSGSPSPPGGQG